MNNNLRETLYLLKNKEFSYFLSSRFVVIFSLFLQNTTLSYLLYSITKDPLTLGILGLAELIPALSLAILAGYYVDKLSKQRVYFYCILFYLINAILLLYFSSDYFIKSHSVSAISWSFYICMFISGAIRAFLGPASFSLLPLIVSKENITRAIPLSSTAWLLGSVLGPLTGGILLATLGCSFSILITCLLLLFSSISMFQIKPKPVQQKYQQESLFQGIKEGFSFLFKAPVILSVLGLDLFAVLFGGAEALLPVFSKDILHVSAVGYGWLRSAHGIGSMFLLLVLTYLPLKTQVGEKLLWSVAGFGLCILLFGISTNIYLSFSLLFFAGLFDGVSVVIRHSILQLKTPERIRGRVASINMMFISSSNELGAFESGITAKYMGTVPAVIFGGCMTILIVLFTYLKVPSLRKVKL
ncbi:MAG: MFS transporter [Chitinophagaceae bacterium]